MLFRSKNGGYFYDDPNFSIDLNSSQIEAIKLAANILEQFKGTEVFKDFDSAIDKILDRVNASEKLQQKEASRYIQFEKAPIVIGTEHLDPLIQAIRDKQKVCFTYQKFKGGNEKERLLDPYLLKEYRNRWYVTGYDTEKENIITYALDRIKNLEVKFQTFETDKNFNPERYFEYAIGITTSNKNPELIKLSLSPTEGKYLKSQPLHHSQKVISDTENECIIQLYVVITYELINQILSLGEGVKVIEPPILVDQIKNSLNNSLNKYS